MDNRMTMADMLRRQEEYEQMMGEMEQRRQLNMQLTNPQQQGGGEGGIDPVQAYQMYQKFAGAEGAAAGVEGAAGAEGAAAAGSGTGAAGGAGAGGAGMGVMGAAGIAAAAVAAQNYFHNKDIASWNDGFEGQTGAKVGDYYMDKWDVDEDSGWRDAAGLLGFGSGAGWLNPAKPAEKIFSWFD